MYTGTNYITFFLAAATVPVGAEFDKRNAISTVIRSGTNKKGT